MTVREYIGARYVPVFSDPIQWDSTVSYEPLTVVMNQGTSYVSKQSVPAGIEIDNETYWLRWADYNAQLEEYIRQVQAYTGEVDAINDALPISDYDSTNTITARFEALEELLPSSDFDSVNTVKAAFDSVDSHFTELEAVLPLTDFDDTNTVDARFDAIEGKFPIDVSDVKTNVVYKPFDPMYYGADNTGTEDSSDAIDACIAANLGKTVVFTPGVYKVSRPIKTPYTSANRMSIDFNGSIIVYEGVNSQTAVLEIGTYEGDTSAMKATGSNNNEIKNYFSNFSISSTALCSSAIYIETHYMNACIENFAIHTETNGITIADPNELNSYPTDVFVSNGLIWANYNNNSQIGININGSDNKFDYLRIYNFYTYVNIKRGGNSFNLIHTLGINANTQAGIGFLIDSGFNDFSNIYNDTVATAFKITYNNYNQMNQIVNFKDYSYNASLANRTFIHVDGVNDSPNIAVNNAMLYVHDNYTGFKATNLSGGVSTLNRMICRISFDNVHFNKDVSTILNDSDLIRSARNIINNSHYASSTNTFEQQGTLIITDQYKPVCIPYIFGTTSFGIFTVNRTQAVDLSRLTVSGSNMNFGVTTIANPLISGVYAYQFYVYRTSSWPIELITQLTNTTGWVFLPKYVGNIINGITGTPEKTVE